jgi:hypothetical protein
LHRGGQCGKAKVVEELHDNDDEECSVLELQEALKLCSPDLLLNSGSHIGQWCDNLRIRGRLTFRE